MDNRKKIIILVSIILVISLFLIYFENYYEINSSIEDNFINPDSIDPSKVHIFMTFDQNYYNKLGKTTTDINNNYCQKYGFNFHTKLFYSNNTNILYKDNELKPHYSRYIYLLELMELYEEDNIYIYIDTDAAILNDSLDIRNWIPKDPETYILFANESNDKNKLIKYSSSLRNSIYGISMSSGIFISRNNNWVKLFLHDILESPICSSREKDDPIKMFDQTCISKIYKNNINNENIHVKCISMKNAIQFTNLKNKDSSLKNIPIFHSIFDKEYYMTDKNNTDNNSYSFDLKKSMNYLL